MYNIGHYVGRAFLAVTGWKVEGETPTAERTVIIAAPHTSNWDFVYLLAAAMVLKVRICWLGKQELFRPPFGGIMRALGGIAVDRSRNTDLVRQVARHLHDHAPISVVVPPSGTRSKAKHWRTGFYHIAQAADAEIVCGYLDYRRKVAGLGHRFMPTGDIAADMEPLREFYAPITARFPEYLTPVKLKEEG